MPLSESSKLDSNQDIIVSGNGSAGTPDTNVITVQGITGGTALPVINPLDTTSSTINITTQDIASTTTVGYASQSLVTGTPTAGSTASYTLSSIQTVMVLISGTWTGTLVPEVSEDGGTTWEPRSIHVVGTSTFSAAITANAVGSMNATAKTNVRIRSTAAMTGTASIKILISDNVSNVYVANAIRLVDGTIPNVASLAIKAGSTLSSPTDTAAVVTLRDTVTVQGPSGVAGTPSGGILTVQGVAGGKSLNINSKTALTPSSPTAVTVAATSGSAVASNANRTGLVLVNTSINTISLNIVGGAAVLNSGITLYPGGTWCMDEYTFTTSAIFAIASAAGSNLSIQELS